MLVRVAALLVGLLVAGCSSPSPPKVTVHSSEFVSSSAKELVVRVHLSMVNVNSYAMTLQSVKAKVTVAGHQVTEVLVPYTISLPPSKEVPVDTDLVIPKPVVQQLRDQAAHAASVPYKVEGSVIVGASGVHVTVPFENTGSVTREVLIQRLRSIPP